MRSRARVSAASAATSAPTAASPTSPSSRISEQLGQRAAEARSEQQEAERRHGHELDRHEEEEQAAALARKSAGAVHRGQQEGVDPALLALGRVEPGHADHRGQQQGDPEHPEASAPSSESRSSPKWNSTKTVSVKRVIAGTDSFVRSSMRRSLRGWWPRCGSRVERPGLGRSPAAARRTPGARPSGRARRRPRPGRASTSWVTSTRVLPEAAPDQRLEQLGRGGVEARARLVEQQQRRVVEHRACRRQRAAPCRARGRAAGSSARRSMPTAPSSSATRAVADPVQAGVVAQVLAAGELAGRAAARGPGSPRRRASFQRSRGSVGSQHARHARVRPQQPGEHPAAAWSCPAPLAPSTTSVWPSSTRRLTPSSALRSP